MSTDNSINNDDQPSANRSPTPVSFRLSLAVREEVAAAALKDDRSFSYMCQSLIRAGLSLRETR